MDVFSKAKRSDIMSRIHGKGTKPERQVRSMVHRMGFRFRLHRKDLPGKPDITLPRHKKVIFVHGCFWHGHEGCPRAKRPSSNQAFWNDKLDKNRQRDAAIMKELTRLGWQVLIVWTCEIKDAGVLRTKLAAFLEMNKTAQG